MLYFRKTLILTFFIFLTLLVVHSASAASNAQLFEGTIGKYPVTFWYTACVPKPNIRCNSEIGEYRYNAHPKLRLGIERQSGSTWVEKDFSSAMAQDFSAADQPVTGKWFVTKGSEQIKGTWVSVNGKKKLPILLKRKTLIKGRSVDYFAKPWTSVIANQFGSQNLTFHLANNIGFQYDILAFHTAHSGVLSGFATWIDSNHAVERSCKKKTCDFSGYPSEDYEVLFTFTKDSVEVSTKNTDQFAGLSVVFDGTYKQGDHFKLVDEVANFFGSEAPAFCKAVTAAQCTSANNTLAVNTKFSEDDALKGFSNVIGEYGFLPGAAILHLAIVKDSSIDPANPYYYEIEQDEKVDVYTNDPRQIVTDWMLPLANIKNNSITKADYVFHVTNELN